MKAIVTVKFDTMIPDYDEHGKIHKVVGVCPVNKNYCSDVYGKHHSYVEEGIDLQDITKKAQQKFGHITRVEII